MRVVFAGTPEFSVPCLEALLEAGGVTLASVYTQPDRPAGRGRKLVPGPVKAAALDAGLPVCQPQTLKAPAQQQHLRSLDVDLMVVIAYGLLLPREVLDIPRLGCVNLHASLLPRWRGAAPIQRAIEAGDTRTGVSLMLMDAGLDTGPVLAMDATPIGPDDTGGSLHDRLSALAAGLLARNLDALARGELEAVPQDDADATYAAKLDKSESALDFTLSALVLERKVRAFHPWPGSTARIHGTTLRVLKTAVARGAFTGSPGEVLRADSGGILVGTGDGLLNIERVQRQGGRAMAAGEFLNGMPIAPGAVFEGR